MFIFISMELLGEIFHTLQFCFDIKNSLNFGKHTVTGKLMTRKHKFFNTSGTTNVVGRHCGVIPVYKSCGAR